MQMLPSNTSGLCIGFSKKSPIFDHLGYLNKRYQHLTDILSPICSNIKQEQQNTHHLQQVDVQPNIWRHSKLTFDENFISISSCTPNDHKFSVKLLQYWT